MNTISPPCAHLWLFGPNQEKEDDDDSSPLPCAEGLEASLSGTSALLSLSLLFSLSLSLSLSESGREGKRTKEKKKRKRSMLVCDLTLSLNSFSFQVQIYYVRHFFLFFSLIFKLICLVFRFASLLEAPRGEIWQNRPKSDSPMQSGRKSGASLHLVQKVSGKSLNKNKINFSLSFVHKFIFSRKIDLNLKLTMNWPFKNVFILLISSIKTLEPSWKLIVFTL